MDSGDIAWGEKRHEAMELIELAWRKHPDVTTAEALLPVVCRLEQGVEAYRMPPKRDRSPLV